MGLIKFSFFAMSKPKIDLDFTTWGQYYRFPYSCFYMNCPSSKHHFRENTKAEKFFTLFLIEKGGTKS